MVTETDIKNWVDEIITPENADVEAKRLTQILMAVACEKDDTRWTLTIVAAQHAFTKTVEFDEAFKEFAGMDANHSVYRMETNIEIEKEQ